MLGEIWSHLGLSHSLKTSRVSGTPTKIRFSVESLEDRTTPALFNPTTVAELIADINTANGNGAADIIDLGGETFTLTSVDGSAYGENGLPSILADGVNPLTITNGVIERDTASSAEFRLLYVINGGDLTLDHVTLRGGLANDMAFGSHGGAIFNRGIVRIQQSILTGNEAADSGGAIYSLGSSEVIIEESAIFANVAQFSGGAIRTDSGPLSIRNSTISGNTATVGGGINNYSSVLEIVNSTVANNTATQAGGIYNSGTLTSLISTIIAGNTATGGNAPDLETNVAPMTATNNLIESADGHTITNGVDGNIVGSPANLGALQNNGGPTPTHALLADSLAINAGANPQMFANDQRGMGFAREADGQTDIGSFEVQEPVIPVPDDGSPFAPGTNERFVENLYRDLLGREPDPAGFAGWVNLLSEGASRSEVVDGFQDSAEHLTRRVTVLYLQLLHREPDAEGLAGWVNFLLEGNSIGTVTSSILASAEYASLHPTPNDFVTALYVDLLGRLPSAEELTSWTSSGLSNQEIVDSFLDSPERITKTIERFYVQFLNRQADPTGLTGFTEDVLDGDLSLNGVVGSILSSDEYYNLVRPAV